MDHRRSDKIAGKTKGVKPLSVQRVKLPVFDDDDEPIYDDEDDGVDLLHYTLPRFDDDDEPHWGDEAEEEE